MEIQPQRLRFPEHANYTKCVHTHTCLLIRRGVAGDRSPYILLTFIQIYNLTKKKHINGPHSKHDYLYVCLNQSLK